MTQKILLFLQEEAVSRFPAFPEAFGQLISVCFDEQSPDSPVSLSSPFGTDGEYLYIYPQQLYQLFLTDTDGLKKCYLHIHLHCLCLHMIQPDSVEPSEWDLACDLSVSLFADLVQNISKSTLYRKLEQILRTFPGRYPSSEQAELLKAQQQLKKSGWLTAQTILPLFSLIPELKQAAETCTRDSHIFWHRADTEPAPVSRISVSCTGSTSGTDTSGPDAPNHENLHKLERILQRWSHRLPETHLAGSSGLRSKAPGNALEEAELRQRDTMDYHRFLRQFAVAREEAILDMDAFDYIPYCYGLSCYREETSSDTDIPFLEPLEYKEVNRLDEFAIAIDTSASCSGTIVRRFLEETWSILRQRENFFSKIRIHLIQCDSMIQDHQIFTSSEQLETAMKNIKIHGLGNTDFRPVFEYLEQLIRSREIRHLRGLLYFTDGDGIFPSHAPSWDTAFVFLNRETEKHAIPNWGIRLNLHIPDLEIAPIRERI